MQQSSKTGESLIDAIGGPEALDLLVGAMYFHILGDARIAHFFADAPIERILMHQKSFLLVTLSGVGDYSGRDLAEAHADLIKRHGLASEHVDIVIEHLRNTLIELGADADVARQVTERIGASKSLIFGAK